MAATGFNSASVLETGRSQPPKISSQKKLGELTDADSNTRSYLPQSNLLKHKITADPNEPPAKRKPVGFQPAEPVRPRSSSVTANTARNRITTRPKATTLRAPPVSGHTRPGSVQAFGQSLSRPQSRTSMNRPPSASGFYAGQPQRAQTPVTASFDIDKQMEQMNKMTETWDAIKTKVLSTSDNALSTQQKLLEMQSDRINQLTAQITSLNEQNANLNDRNSALEADLRDVRSDVTTLTMEVETVARRGQMRLEEMEHSHRRQISDLQDHHRQETNILKEQAFAEIGNLKRDREEVIMQAREEIEKSKHGADKTTEELRAKLKTEMEEFKQQFEFRLESENGIWRQKIEQLEADKERISRDAYAEVERLRQEKIAITVQHAQFQAALDAERATAEALRNRLSEDQARMADLEAYGRTMKSKIDFLESDSHAQGEAYADMRRRMDEALRTAQEAEEKLRQEERVRRKLHNQIQELKGNIRVFCRVRPALVSPTSSSPPRIAELGYPDEKEEGRELVVTGPARETLTGMLAPSINAYGFDKVFGPSATNSDVFDEISQLVQSALDGYNVCIFCYGQTGSGKTFTMSQPGDGMIPRAVQQIWEEKERLRPKGWNYHMTGEFVEVYNEQLNDLLGRADELDRKKLEIRHDPSRGRTTIMDATVVPLDSPDTVHELLEIATRNRSVAATKSNERSSRSHTVFILKIYGANAITGEQCEGVLNLVDLAGSERVKVSGVEGARMREAQNINRSLSCLGDVISALGNAKPDGKDNFVPYRNSKLTYLLQYSLGGNSKTLMFVMVSPLYDHLAETTISLKFATKVYNTHIGPARKQIK